MPQSAPNSGASACGAIPCKIETQDAQIRSAPVFRVDATTGRPVVVVTSDRQVVSDTSRFGAWSTASQVLLDRLG